MNIGKEDWEEREEDRGRMGKEWERKRRGEERGLGIGMMRKRRIEQKKRKERYGKQRRV